MSIVYNHGRVRYLPSVLCLALLPSITSAETIHVVGDPAGCPSPIALANELRGTLTLHPVDTNLSTEGSTALVVDLGEKYRVTFKGFTRDFDDEPHNCQERVREASVYLTLVIEPPTLLEPLPESEPPPSPRPKPAPAPRRIYPLTSSLDLAGFIEGAPQVSDTITGGGAVRASVGIRPVSAILGAAVSSYTTLKFPVASADILRVPFDVGIRGSLHVKQFELSGDLELAITLQHIRATGLQTNNITTQADFGIRTALQLRWWVTTRVAPFVAIQGLISPRPLSFTINSLGNAGTAPYLWLGGCVGLSFEIK